MRELKFRAWIDDSDLCNEEELYYHLDENGDFVPFMQDLDCWYFDDGQTLGDYLSSFGKGNVTQYTGRKDENEIEIYEGYILHAKGHYPGEGWYDTGEHEYDFVAKVEYDNDCQAYKCGGYYLHELDLIKVIGNIWENPELLEV